VKQFSIVVRLFVFLLIFTMIQSGVGAVSAQVPASLTEVPSDFQLYPRDESGGAWVQFTGSTELTRYAFLEVEIRRDGEPWSLESVPLSASGNQLRFDTSIWIKAGLHAYDFDAYLVSSHECLWINSARNVVSGDVYLIQGQSNATAWDVHHQGLANQSQRPWIRSFGTASFNGNKVASDLEWHLAEGLEANGPGTVGAWALRMAQEIVDTYEIPIAVLNGSVPGTRIGFQQRNDADPERLRTNYGRLLFRTRQAGIDEAPLSIFWYQGESNVGLPLNNYLRLFRELRDDWKEDYPGLSRIYVLPIRDIWDSDDDMPMRELQRRFGDIFPDVTIMSTEAAPRYDRSHFFYEGYREIGDRMSRLIARDFHGSTDVIEITAPNPDYAQFTGPERDEILLVFREPDDRLIWETGVHAKFQLGDKSAKITSGTVIDGVGILLHLNRSANLTTLSYKGGIAANDAVILNARGIGAFAFMALPINPE
jgi:hypothetical protein